MLEHDEIMFAQQCLLAADIDGEVRIGGIEVVKCDAVQIAHRIGENAMDM
jgi:hypothetical protein